MSSGARAALVALAILVATGLVYRPVGGFDFVGYGDPESISSNPIVRDAFRPGSLRAAFLEPPYGLWHPLTTYSFVLVRVLFGDSAAPQHLLNLALHGTGALLLFWLLLRATQDAWRSGFAAALFALHPLAVESVAWVSGRQQLLGTCLALGAAHAYLGYVAAPGLGRYLALAGLSLLALLAAPSMAVWPLLLLLLDVWPLGRLREPGALRSVLPEKLPLLLLSAVAGVFALRSAFPDANALPARQLALAVVGAVHTLAAALWPVGLAPLQPAPEPPPLWQLALSLGLLAGLTAACVAVRRRHPYLLVGWLWYAVALLPWLGMATLGLPPRADRYAYLPLVGLGVAAVWGLGSLSGRGLPAARALASGGLAALAVLGLLASRQVTTWRSSTHLYEHALEVSGGSPAIRSALGAALVAEGRHEEAIRVLERGLDGSSELDSKLSYNVGVAYARAGRPGEALAAFDRALATDRDNPEILYQRGQALVALGQHDEAVGVFERVITLAPEQAEAHVALGLAFGRTNRPFDAMRHFQQALELDPRNADARINYAIALFKIGDRRSAVEQVERVLEMHPDHGPAREYLKKMSAP